MILRKKWLTKEVNFLLDNYPTHGHEYCASHLDIQITQVINKVKQMKLTRGNNMSMQKCTKCCQLKSLDNFFNSSKGRNGKHAACKSCFAEKEKNRYRDDKSFRLKKLLRKRYKFVSDKSFTNERKVIFGCDEKDFVNHIEKQFDNDMDWNTNNWELDHIIPISILRKYPDKMHLVFNYRNHQPLLSIENSLKSDNLKLSLIHLKRKIELFGKDDFYSEMLTFLENCAK